MTLEQMPSELEQLKTMVVNTHEMMKAIYEKQPILEPPITAKTCWERLSISETQFQRLRKRGDIPFIEVGGNYRFLWPQVLSSLTNKKKKAGKANIVK